MRRGDHNENHNHQEDRGFEPHRRLIRKLAVKDNSTTSLPATRRLLIRAAWKRTRQFRGPTWSCAEWAMALAGRAVALAQDDQHRPDALREDARVLAELVRNHEILKPDAVDRILDVGIAFGIEDYTIYEILRSEFAS
jgi:hypothetical protein